MSVFKKFLLGVVIAVVTHVSHASLTQVSSRSSIGVGYTIDWAGFGIDQTAVVSGSSLGGVTVAGASVFAVFSGATFNADFSASDSILSVFDIDAGNPVAGVFSLSFASAVRSAGAQVQANFEGLFSGSIEAFDSLNVSLGMFAVNGTNSFSADGSAVFAGIVSDSLNIKRLEFSGFGDGAGINLLSVGDVLDTVSTVPEPAGLALVLAALGLLTVTRRRGV